MSRQVKPLRVKFTVDDSDTLFCVILGRTVVFEELAKELFDSLGLKPVRKAKILTRWSKAGFIEGSADDWKINSSLLTQKKLKHVNQNPAQSSYNRHSEAFAEPTILDLVRAYKEALRALRERGKKSLQQRNVVNFFRTMVRSYKPAAIMAALPGFFNHAAGSNNYDLSAFGVYLKATVKRR